MPKREDVLLLKDIAECGKNIMEYTSGIDYETFIVNKMMVDAVIRNLEVIGEAANILSDELKKENPEVEWKQMTRFRNLLIHFYFGVDHEIVWNVVKNNLEDNNNIAFQLIITFYFKSTSITFTSADNVMPATVTVPSLFTCPTPWA